MIMSYNEMKKLMQILDAYDINYHFGNYYKGDLIIGHWLTIEAQLETDEIDEIDKNYNET